MFSLYPVSDVQVLPIVTINFIVSRHFCLSSPQIFIHFPDTSFLPWLSGMYPFGMSFLQLTEPSISPQLPLYVWYKFDTLRVVVNAILRLKVVLDTILLVTVFQGGFILNSVTWSCSKCKITLCHRYIRYLHQTTTIVFIILPAAKFYLSSTIIGRVSSLGYAIFLQLTIYINSQIRNLSNVVEMWN